MENGFSITPVWISLKTATTATAITFFLGIMAARWMLDYQGKLKGLIEGLLTAPLVLPPTVVGFLLLLLFGRHGLFGQVLNPLGITVIFSWSATVIASTVVAFPLMYKTALGAFQQIDANLLACARTLGASETRIFWQVILPLAKHGLIAGTLLSFARALGEFGATLMLAGSIPGKTETIPIAIFFAAEGGAMDRALLLVVIMLAISLGVITAVNYGTAKHRVYRSKLRKKTKLLLPSAKPQPANNYSLPPSTIGLDLDIQKQLPGFLLNVRFQTGQAPLGLLGASGAGKSLILRCIAGLETPDTGRIILNGRVLFDSQKKINLPPRDRTCGILFQSYALFPHLTVAENIAFGMPLQKSRREQQQEIERQLIAVDLLAMGDRFPEELSGGQQQRVALARAKASKPGIMLLDEPFSALDTYLRDKQAKLLQNNLIHYPGVTLFITHNLEEAYRICPQLLILDQGKAIAYGSKQAIFRHAPNFRTAQLTGCKNFSPVVVKSARQIQAIDWNCLLETSEPVTESIKYVGIHAHNLTFPDTNNGINTFPCWLVGTSETQHHVTLYLKLNRTAHNSQDYDLQAEVLPDQWLQLQNIPLPWNIQLDSFKIMLLKA